MTEICVQVLSDLDTVKSELTDKGFEFVEYYNNHDIYFSTIPEEDIHNVEYKALLDRSIIIRHIKGNESDDRYIVYKSKTLDDAGNVVNEKKTKLVIDDIAKAKAVFTGLGLTRWCEYDNENHVYKKGDISIIVQYVRELGVFFEIEEFEFMSEKSSTEKFDELIKIARSLGFDLGDDFSCKKPYLYLNRDPELTV